MTKSSEIYISIDCESDGPCCAINNLLSFGAAAFTSDAQLIDTFSANLLTLPDCKANPETERWWTTQPEAWAECRKDPQPPEKIMVEFSNWIIALPGPAIAIGYPVFFDYQFIHYYLHRFTGKCVLGFSCLDIKTAAMIKLGKTYRESTKRNFPKHWFKGGPRHDHTALNDALGQATLFFNLMFLSYKVTKT